MAASSRVRAVGDGRKRRGEYPCCGDPYAGGVMNGCGGVGEWVAAGMVRGAVVALSVCPQHLYSVLDLLADCGAVEVGIQGASAFVAEWGSVRLNEWKWQTASGVGA